MYIEIDRISSLWAILFLFTSPVSTRVHLFSEKSVFFFFHFVSTKCIQLSISYWIFHGENYEEDQISLLMCCRLSFTMHPHYFNEYRKKKIRGNWSISKMLKLKWIFRNISVTFIVFCLRMKRNGRYITYTYAAHTHTDQEFINFDQVISSHLFVLIFWSIEIDSGQIYSSATERKSSKKTISIKHRIITIKHYRMNAFQTRAKSIGIW